jgi:hypothetical protein
MVIRGARKVLFGAKGRIAGADEMAIRRIPPVEPSQRKRRLLSREPIDTHGIIIITIATAETRPLPVRIVISIIHIILRIRMERQRV